MKNKSILRKARLSKGLTEKQVAEYVGVAPQTVSDWEQGELPNMRIQNLRKLAEILDLSPNDISGYTESIDPEVILIAKQISQNENLKELFSKCMELSDFQVKWISGLLNIVFDQELKDFEKKE